MTTPSSRKSTRGKKVALDLTNPRSQLAKCDDIKAMLKDKVRKLSQEAQKELIMLLPACDQQYDDLNNALNANSTFWSSLDEWHCLLQCGDLKSSKRNPSARDLQSIPWKDDNYEHFWGERMKLNKHSTKGDEPQPQQSLPKVRQQSKTTRKPKTTEKPKVERRGRKKKNVEPPPEHDDKDSVLASVKPVKNGVGSDGTKPEDSDEKLTINGAVPTDTANETRMDINTKSAATDNEKPSQANPATHSIPTSCFSQFSINPNEPPAVDTNEENTARTTMGKRHMTSMVPQPAEVDNDLLIYDENEEDEEKNSTITTSSKPAKSPKRPRKSNKTAWPMNEDDFQYSDVDPSDIRTPVRKKTSRTRTVSN